VTDHRETARWKASWALAVGSVAAGFLLALAPVAISSLTDRLLILGLPTSYFLGGVIVPLLIAVAIFWSASSQDRIDRRYDGLQD
jgi:putative solute:sodium symporter small subunit